ncbi:MAG: ferrous iron transport protein A [Spirochaetae bacterium HGW-Spirochaetae-8]|nr:MAG: ferrous iron transport protein A [Spirochaetae bacterium HGW-Spirochaetae-8]
MPLTFMKIGESACIKRVIGKDDTQRFLGSLGFTTGQSVTIIAQSGGNLILSVKDSRVALDKSMAQRIHV